MANVQSIMLSNGKGLHFEEMAYEIGEKKLKGLNKTLIIGCGGSGGGVVRTVKRGIKERFVDALKVTKFLVIDTESAAFGPKPGQEDIEETEKCILDGRGALELWRVHQAGGIMDEVIPKRGISDEVVKVLASGTGAGQRRVNGKIAMLGDFANVRDSIHRQLDPLLGLRTEGAGQNVSIFVVASFCGGTGSGIFLDVAALTRKVMEERFPKANIQLFGIFGVVSEGVKNFCPQAQQPIIRINTYAALTELQYLQEGSREAPKMAPPRAVFKYTKAEKYELRGNLFDQVYLVQGENLNGHLDDYNDVNSMVGRFLMVTVTSPEMARKISALNADDTFLAGLTTDVVSRKRINLIGLSACTLHMSVYDLYVHSALRLARDVVYAMVGNTISDIEAEVRTFLQRNQMEERGLKQNQLVNRVMAAAKIRAEDCQISIPPSKRQDYKETARRYRKAIVEFASQLREKSTRMREAAASTPTAGESPQARRLYNECGRALVAGIDEAFKRGGTKFASQFAEEILRVCHQVTAELSKEIADLDRSNLGGEICKKLDEVLKAWPIPFLGYWQEDNINFVKDNYDRYVVSVLEGEAKRALIPMLSTLGKLVESQAAALKTVEANLETLNAQMASRCNEIHDRVARSSQAFSLDISCASPEMLDILYGMKTKTGRQIADSTHPDENWVELMARKPWHEIGNLFLETCADEFVKPIREDMNVTEFVRQVFDPQGNNQHATKENRAFLSNCVEKMARFTKPFWTLNLPVNAMTGKKINPNFYMYVGISDLRGDGSEDPAAVVITAKLQEQALPHGYNPGITVPVPTYYGGAIDVIGIACAARGAYLSVSETYRAYYKEWVEDESKPYPHVFTEEFIQSNNLDLFAGTSFASEEAAKSKILQNFAFAMAYGYISATGDTAFYWNLDAQDNYKCASSWKTIPEIKTGKPLAGNPRGLKPDRITHEGRKKAFELWGTPAHQAHVERVETLLQDKLKIARKETIDDLGQYIGQVLEDKIQKTDGDLQMQLIAERDVLQALVKNES